MVSPELETANAISAILGIPAARHTDVFADGKVQIVEFDVPRDVPRRGLVGRALRDAEIPVAQGGRADPGELMIVPRGRPDPARATASSSSARPLRRGRGAG